VSGICGLVNQDGAPVSDDDVRRMASLLERRGPEGTHIWGIGPAGLGHTLLATIPEALAERLPLADGASGCVITADVRLDNRAELLEALRLEDLAATVGDAGLVLAAYLRWDTACVEHFLGDFAFAIWDARQRRLFCARDHFGLRPLYYHHSAGHFFAFASAPRAILVLPQTPYRLNEGRIADFLVSQLEGIDKTSTFFEEVYRLPPAHALTVTPEGLRLWQYWTLQPQPELQLPSDEAYAEAFLDVLTRAVCCRLRSAGPIGATLSGGVDSGSVVAVGRQLLSAAGRGPLPTFSAVGPDPTPCVETRTIHAALTMEGLDPHLVSFAQLDDLLPELAELMWNLDEPFDNHMALLQAVYLLAHCQGLKALLDGAAGDVVLSEGTYLARLLRSGRWLKAWREAVGQQRFWGDAYPAWRQMLLSTRVAFTPNAARRLRRRLVSMPHVQLSARRPARGSIINPEFAKRIALGERLHILDGYGRGRLLPDYGEERVQAIDHPYVVVGRERYDRVAAACAVEPRDPFLDRRVVVFCLGLPGEQRLSGGWPKAILRRAVAGRLPDAVRWRLGKQHLGSSFTKALMELMKDQMQSDLQESQSCIEPYLRSDVVAAAARSYFDQGNEAPGATVYEAVHLALWLRRHAARPQVMDSIAAQPGQGAWC
jgi:asparagine synthase (glutamine-hydrolysing)